MVFGESGLGAGRAQGVFVVVAVGEAGVRAEGTRNEAVTVFLFCCAGIAVQAIGLLDRAVGAGGREWHCALGVGDGDCICSLRLHFHLVDRCAVVTMRVVVV